MEIWNKIKFKNEPIWEVVNTYTTELIEWELTEMVRVAFVWYELEFPASLFDITETEND